MCRWLFACLLTVVFPIATAFAERTSLPRAHAHNDYEHSQPLTDALEQGFCSVEADVHLVNGSLLVAHDRSDVSPDRTLQRLYLDPLRDRIRDHDGSVHGDEQPFTLLIDVKSDAVSTYAKLDEVLAEYAELLTRNLDGQVTVGPIVAIVSGNRAFAAITSDPSRYVGIDGRLGDLGKDTPADLMPLISDHWGRSFRWRGSGEMPQEEFAKLKRIVQQAHQQKRRIRFWATPDRLPMWRTLHQAGVDLINTDDLKGLSDFLRQVDR